MSDATKLNWLASYASQGDYAANPNDYAADCYLLEGGATFGKFGLKAGYEVLGGDDQPNHAFQTPLATLHAFQGWADKFLTTPRGGAQVRRQKELRGHAQVRRRPSRRLRCGHDESLAADVSNVLDQ